MDILANPINFIVQFLTQWLTGWGMSADLINVVLDVVGGGILATGAMLWVTVLIWYERKLIGRIQDRFGPNRVGPWGIFQPIAVMIKIFTKEHISPEGIDWFPYNIAPIAAVGAVLAVWSVIPFAANIYGVNLNVGVLFILGVGGLGELAIVMGGWGSNNKFALLSAFRAVAQLISYETPFVICLIVPVMLSGSMGINDIVKAQDTWFIFYAPLIGLIFFITSIAEVGRAPFDLAEGESEIVAGFNIEYSGLKFGMFYVADFLHAFTVALIFALMFLGGWKGPWVDQVPLLGILYLFIKTSLIYFLGILIRASMPRFRIDQMMDFNWKILTPLSLVSLAITAIVYKLLPPEIVWLKIVVLLAINVILYLITDRIMESSWKKYLNQKLNRHLKVSNVNAASQGVK